MAFNGLPQRQPTADPIRQGDPAGGDLTGFYPNPLIKTGAVTSDKIAAGAVGNDELANDSVDCAKLAPIPDLCIFPLVSGSQIISGLLTNAHISDNACIDINKIKQVDTIVRTTGNQRISGIKMFHRGRVPHDPVLAFDIVNKEYVDNQIQTINSGTLPTAIDVLEDGVLAGTRAKLNFITGPNIDLDISDNVGLNRVDIVISGTAVGGGGAPTGAAGGDLTGTYPNPLIADSAVSGNKIQSESILNGHLAPCSVSGNKICPESVLTGHLGNSSISGNKIQSESILNGHLAPCSISGNRICAESIQLGHLADCSVSGNKICSGAISFGNLVESVRVLTDGTPVGIRKNLNFITGTGIQYDITDNPTSDRIDIIISGTGAAGGGGSPTGPAGGDLTGNYPDPIIANNAVSGNKIQSESILNGHLAPCSVSGNRICPESVLLSHLADCSVSGSKICDIGIDQRHVENGYVDLSTDQIISGDKTFHRPKASGDPIDGTDLATKDYVDNAAGPPSGAAGGDLTGTYPNPLIANSAVSGNKIQSESILNGHLADCSISGDKICSESILNGHLADCSISGNKICAESIQLGHLDDCSVSGSKICDIGIDQRHIENGYVDLTSDQIISGNKTFHRPKASGDPIDGTDLATKDYVDNTPSTPTGPAGGDLTGTYPNPLLANCSVSGNKICAESVQIGHLAACSVSGNKICSGAIGFGNLVESVRVLTDGTPVGIRKNLNFITGTGIQFDITDNSSLDRIDVVISGTGAGGGSPSGPAGGDLTGTYPNPLIADSAVSGNKIQSESILNGHLAPCSVSGNKICPESVLLSHLADCSVSGSKICDSGITQSHIENGYVNLSSDQIISGDKTFHRPKASGDPIDGTDLATKDYVDNTPSTPTGPAGGDLTGTYPNPLIANSAVSGNKIQSESILNGHLADCSVSGNKICAESIQLGHLADCSVSGNKICSGAVDFSHLVTSVRVLTDGTPVGIRKNLNFITGTGIQFDIADNAASDRIDIIISGTGAGGAGGSPTGPAGGDLTGTYPNPLLANCSVSGNKICAESIQLGHLADCSVSGSKICDIGIAQNHVENGYVDLTSDQIISGDKTFHRPKASGDPIEGLDLATKDYVDDTAISVSLFNSTPVNINSNTETEVTWADEDHDTDNLHSLTESQNIFIKKTGNYVLLTSIKFESDEDGLRRLRLYKNFGESGQEILAEKEELAPSRDRPAEIQLQTSKELTSGSKISVTAFHTANDILAVCSGIGITSSGIGAGVFSATGLVGSTLTVTPTVTSGVGTSVAVFNESPIIVNSDTETEVTWSDEDHDTNNFHSTSSQTESLFINEGGQYVILTSIKFQPDKDGFRRLRLYKNFGQSDQELLAEKDDLNPSRQRPSEIQLQASKNLTSGVRLSVTAFHNGINPLGICSGLGLGVSGIGAGIFSATGLIGATGGASGAAGGDLTGTYPNPTLANCSVSGNKICAESILQGHVKNNYVDLVENQIISGEKTFYRPKASGNPIDGNDLTTKDYVDSVATGDADILNIWFYQSIGV